MKTIFCYITPFYSKNSSGFSGTNSGFLSKNRDQTGKPSLIQHRYVFIMFFISKNISFDFGKTIFLILSLYCHKNPAEEKINSIKNMTGYTLHLFCSEKYKSAICFLQIETNYFLIISIH